MSRAHSKILMQIRDPVHGPIDFDPSEAQVINHPWFQRLRQIRQLGFAELSFPGATHHRFLHSLGVVYVISRAFDSIFQPHKLEAAGLKIPGDQIFNFRKLVRLAALLHDIGHGPLSHSCEALMPPVTQLQLPIQNSLRLNSSLLTQKNDQWERQATHEDYTLKIILDSDLTSVLEKAYPEINPYHAALLLQPHLVPRDNFFLAGGYDWRPILSQLISSELDCDRMDYLERDSYFCGTNYGKIDFQWLISQMLPFAESTEKCVYLAVSKRALYTIDDFLLARHHMYLMVYYHHKSVIFEEFLNRYARESSGEFQLPAGLDTYMETTDQRLYQALQKSNNPWAKRIIDKKAMKVLIELHFDEYDPYLDHLSQRLHQENIFHISLCSSAQLSRYGATRKAWPIFVVDPYVWWQQPMRLEQATEIFKKYEKARNIYRIYVNPEDLQKCEKIIPIQQPFRVLQTNP